MSSTGSLVKFGVSVYEMWILCQLDAGAHASAKVPSLSSGLPMARMRLCRFDAIVSAAIHRSRGMPHASSRMTRTYSAWIPWNALWL